MLDLGPQNFVAKGRIVERIDFEFVNKRGLLMKCRYYFYRYFFDNSYYKQKYFNRDCVNEDPAVIYLHGNASSRLEGTL